MRYLLGLIVIFIVFSCNAKKNKISLLDLKDTAITVTGKFRDENRVLHLSKIIQRLLFIKKQGNLTIPENGYFLMLSDSSAKKIKQKFIIVIPTEGDDGTDFYSDSKENISFQLVNLHPDLQDVFYIVGKNDSKKTMLTTDVFTSPKVTDTLSWTEIMNNDESSHLREWIDCLDDKRKVTIQGTMFIEYSNGRCDSKPTFDQMAMSEVAKNRLHVVALLFDDVDPLNWNKTQWHQWHDKIFNQHVGLSKTCNAATWSQSIYYNYSNKNSAIYATDPISDMTYRLERLPNIKEYQDQQLMVFDSLGSQCKRYHIDNSKYPKASSFELFVVNNGTLFLLTQYLRWYQCSFNASSQSYEIVKEVFLSPNFSGKKIKYRIIESYKSDSLMFLLIEKNNTPKDRYVLRINSFTGQNMIVKPLSPLLKFFANDYEIQNITSVKNHVEAFYFTVSKKGDSDDFHLVKINSDFSKINQMKISRNMAYGFILPIENALLTIESESDQIIVKSYSSDLSKMNSIKSLETPNSLDNIFVLASPDKLSLFQEQNNDLSVNIIRYDLALKNLQLINQTCMYSYIPIEEIDSENDRYIFDGSFVKGGYWKIFFKDLDDLRWAESK